MGVERKGDGGACLPELLKATLRFDAHTINEALNAALAASLLCEQCTSMLHTRDSAKQSDFCSGCQAVIGAQLGLIVERRLQRYLAQNGMPPDAVKLTSGT